VESFGVGEEVELYRFVEEQFGITFGNFYWIGLIRYRTFSHHRGPSLEFGHIIPTPREQIRNRLRPRPKMYRSSIGCQNTIKKLWLHRPQMPVFLLGLSVPSYISGDYQDRGTLEAIKKKWGHARRPAHYLAVDPSLFETVIEGLCGQQVNVIPLQRENRPVGSRRPSNAQRKRLILVHFGVLRFRCD
jgi:hypothetical protein